MSTYTPDRWELVKLVNTKTGEVIYKILAGWSGGYVQSASWKISSGIETVIELEDRYEILNSSGSTYVCYKDSRGVTVWSLNAFDSYAAKLHESKLGTIELIQNLLPSQLSLENQQ